MGSQRIQLSGISADLEEKDWEAEGLLRIGRLDHLEVVLSDSSISRCHAEVAYTEQGWVVRDLGSTNGTFLNGIRVGRVDQKLRPHDFLQFGNAKMVVSQLDGDPSLRGQNHRPPDTPPNHKKDRNLFLQAVTALTQAVDLRDKYTGGHTQRVTDYALLLANELQLSATDCHHLRIGTPLHDIGKIGIDDAILRKSSKLTAEEFEAMKAHALRGAAIVETIPDLAPIIPIVRNHHERWDGTGYPDGLAGENIPLLARIVAIADAFDAMITTRPYRHGLTLDQTFAELTEKAGTDFDPACVQAFLRLRPRIEVSLRQRQSTSQTVLKLTELAFLDSLTGLPNRRYFEDRLEQAMGQARAQGHLTAVLFLDLDGFKRINDTLGHHIGDCVLQHVAGRLKSCVRACDTVSRLGGDEFTVVLGGIVAADDAVEIARKVLLVLAEPFSVQEHELFVTTSIGISLFPADGEDSDGLVKKADIAMYRAKELGKNNAQLYNQSMPAATSACLAQKNRLQQALEKGELVLHYQPQLDLTSGAINGVEVLLRWQHPEMGLIFPEQFLALAEDTGLLVPIGDWILRTACLQNREWERAGLPPIRVAVNLSTRQFRHKSLPDTVAQVLRDTGLDPQRLVLEITESTVTQHAEDSLGRLRGLKDLGVQLLIDGFGSGSTSFNHLRRLPLDMLKIDQAFVQGIPSDRCDQAITRALITLAESLKLKVIAKHVETEEQLVFLIAQHCHEMQGFLFSPPLPADALPRLLSPRVVHCEEPRARCPESRARNLDVRLFGALAKPPIANLPV